MHDYTIWADLLSKFHTASDIIKFAMLFAMVAVIAITLWFSYKIIIETARIIFARRAAYTSLSSNINNIGVVSETAHYRIIYQPLSFKEGANP